MVGIEDEDENTSPLLAVRREAPPHPWGADELWITGIEDDSDTFSPQQARAALSG